MIKFKNELMSLSIAGGFIAACALMASCDGENAKPRADAFLPAPACEGEYRGPTVEQAVAALNGFERATQDIDLGSCAQAEQK